MQILSIRDRAGSIRVKYELENATATLTTGAVPPQEFVTALEALSAVVRSILDVSEQWMGRVKVTGITLTKCGEDNAEVVIVACRDYAQGGTPFNIATPSRFLRPGAEENGGNELALSPGDAALIQELCVQAEAYVQTNPTMRQFYLPGFGSDAAAVTQAASTASAQTVDVGAAPTEEEAQAESNTVPFPGATEKPKRTRKPKDGAPADDHAAAGGE